MADALKQQMVDLMQDMACDLSEMKVELAEMLQDLGTSNALLRHGERRTAQLRTVRNTDAACRLPDAAH